MKKLFIFLFFSVLIPNTLKAVCSTSTFYEPPCYSTTTKKATMGLAGGPLKIYNNSQNRNIAVEIGSSSGVVSNAGIKASTLTVTGTTTLQGLTQGTTANFGVYYGYGGYLEGISGSTGNYANFIDVANSTASLWASLNSTYTWAQSNFTAVAVSTTDLALQILQPNNTHYIRNSSTLQSGSTFFASSGTAINLYQNGNQAIDAGSDYQTKTGSFTASSIGIGIQPNYPFDIGKG